MIHTLIKTAAKESEWTSNNGEYNSFVRRISSSLKTFLFASPASAAGSFASLVFDAAFSSIEIINGDRAVCWVWTSRKRKLCCPCTRGTQANTTKTEKNRNRRSEFDRNRLHHWLFHYLSLILNLIFKWSNEPAAGEKSNIANVWNA